MILHPLFLHRTVALWELNILVLGVMSIQGLELKISCVNIFA